MGLLQEVAAIGNHGLIGGCHRDRPKCFGLITQRSGVQIPPRNQIPTCRLDQTDKKRTNRYSPTARSRLRSHVTANRCRSSSSVTFRYRCVCLMSACPPRPAWISAGRRAAMPPSGTVTELGQFGPSRERSMSKNSMRRATNAGLILVALALITSWPAWAQRPSVPRRTFPQFVGA